MSPRGAAPASSLLLLAHGATILDAGAGAVAQQAARLTATGRFRAVAAAALDGGPDPRRVLETLPDGDVAVLPMAMAEGFVTRERMPASLGVSPRHRLHWTAPIGVAPGFAALVGRRFAAAARSTDGHRRVLAAHGSARSAQSRLATERVIVAIGGTAVAGYLAEPPDLATVLAAEPGRPVLLLGLFADWGAHAAHDVAAAVAQARAAGAMIADLGIIGADPALADLAAELAVAAVP